MNFHYLYLALARLFFRYPLCSDLALSLIPNGA